MNKISDLILAALLLTIAIFGGAILEWLDPGRIDERIEYNQRQAALNEQHTAERAEIARLISEYRRANPNDSTCGWSCIQRMARDEGEWE